MRLAAMQSPPGLLIHTVTSPLSANSSLRNCSGVMSSSNQLSSAIVPESSRILALPSSSLWFFHCQNFLFFITLLLGCVGNLVCECPCPREGEHVSVDEIEVSPILVGYLVHVLQRSDIVGTHPSVLACGGIAAHAALVVATQQPFDIEAKEMRLLLIGCQQCTRKRLLPADDPRVEGVFDELQRLLLDVAKRGLLQVPHHVRGDAEDARDLVDLELACLQKLRLLGRDRDGGVFHPLLEHRNLVRVGRAAELALPRIAQAGRVLHRSRVLQYPAWGSPVGEKLRPIL